MRRSRQCLKFPISIHFASPDLLSSCPLVPCMPHQAIEAFVLCLWWKEFDRCSVRSPVPPLPADVFASGKLNKQQTAPVLGLISASKSEWLLNGILLKTRVDYPRKAGYHTIVALSTSYPSLPPVIHQGIGTALCHCVFDSNAARGSFSPSQQSYRSRSWSGMITASESPYALQLIDSTPCS